MKKILIIPLLTFLMVGNAQANKIQIVTEDFPPYNYRESNGIVGGIASDVVRAVCLKLNIEFSPKVLPWSRAMMIAKSEPNTLIYSIGRNSTRENQFKWIGVIAPADFYLFALSTQEDINIKSLEDAKRYKIATVQDDVREQFLISKGFVINTHLDSTTSHDANFQKLLRGRVDLWAMPELTALRIIKNNGMPADTIKRIYKLSELSTGGYYMAFGINTPDQTVSEFRSALETVKSSGEYQRILDAYLK